MVVVSSFIVPPSLEQVRLFVHIVGLLAALSFMDGQLTFGYLTVMFSQRISAKAATNILSTGSFG
jgi:hypothetical protein